MDDGFLNWGFMPSTTGYILVSANTEYASIDTTLLKAGSFEEVYPEFINKVVRTQGEWFSGLSRDDLPDDMRNTFEEKEGEMLKFLHETPSSEVKKIMDPLTPPIHLKNADGPIWTSFNGWDWDWAIGFTFRVRGPYLQAMIKNTGKPYPRPARDDEEIDFLDLKGPICSYWAEDTTDEYYGTNISLIKL
tara:strand:- start:5634 stop:6203 length:570 start_codon:yes stop_codon:yes gene_type:complete